MRRVGAVVLVLLLSGGMGRAQEPLALQDCIAIALEQNAGVLTAREAVRMAQARTGAAYAGILPVVQAAAYTRQSRIAPTANNRVVVDGVQIGGGQTGWLVNTDHRWGLTYSQALYDGGQWWNEIKQGRTAEHAADAGAEQVGRTTVLQTKVAYFTLLKEVTALDVLEEALKLADAQSARAGSLFDAGAVAAIDVFRSRINQNTLQIGVRGQRARIEVARADLNRLMGRSEESPLQIVPMEPRIVPLALGVDELLAVARDGSPQLEQLRQTAASAEYGIKVARGALLPVLSLDINYGRNNSTFRRVYGNLNRDFNWGYGLTLGFNLFDGNATRSAIQMSRASAGMARTEILAAEHMLERDLRAHYVQYQTVLDQLPLYEDNVSQAENNLRMAEGRYREGAGTIHEVLDAQEVLMRSRLEMVQAKYDGAIWQAYLEAETGLPIDRAAAGIVRESRAAAPVAGGGTGQ